MESFFYSLKVGELTSYKHGFNRFLLRQDGVVLAQDPVSLELVVYAVSVEAAIQKFRE